MEERDNARSAKILCVEDEPEMIDLIQLILERKGYQVIGAVGGQKGIDAIDQEKPDVVLLDIMMPEVDGWAVFQHIKTSPDLSDTPVIIVTAKAQSIDKVLGLYIAKVDDYITKPFGPQDLVDSVEKILAKRSDTDQSVP